MNEAEAKKWIKDFLAKVDSQDNRATAQPLLFLLQQKQEYVAHDECNHQTETVYHHHTFEGDSSLTRAEAEQRLAEYGFEGAELEREKEEIEEFQMGHHWETCNVFFTEDGVKRHYELNGHNLRKHRDYVIHAFRNPEMKELFAALRALV